LTVGAFVKLGAVVSSGPRGRWLRGLRGVALACCAGGVLGLASAQSAQPVSSARAPSAGPGERSMGEWLLRLRQSSRVPSYVGTFVVSSVGGALSSARIWHVRAGGVQMERVETLSGTPRSTFRRNDAVVIFLPRSHTVKTEQYQAGGVSPNLFGADALKSTADFYTARQIGEDRVAGFDADVVELDPRDSLRFGYRIWSEKGTGLVIKTQTLDPSDHVLEQAAFSELELDAPVNVSSLGRMMSRTDGYRIEKSDPVPTTAEAEGWSMKSAVPGFKPQGCYRRTASALPVVQWIFSDGLATVSLFMEPFDAERHPRQGTSAMGATHTLARRLTSSGTDWWVTAVGEAPVSTLRAFIDRLERRK
jgi:sigma-E factor negative regulatory protein RseB